MNLVKFFMPEETKVDEAVVVDMPTEVASGGEPTPVEDVLVVDLAVDAVSTEIAPAMSAPVDEGLVLSPNTAAQPVDAGLNITA